MEFLHVNYEWLYVLFGGMTIFLAFIAWKSFEHFRDDVLQETRLFLRQKYWLFYLLTFLAGARRQIVVVFAGFLLVEKFGFNAQNMVLLLIANTIINMMCAPYAGKLIERFGEKLSLRFEYFLLLLLHLKPIFKRLPTLKTLQSLRALVLLSIISQQLDCLLHWVLYGCIHTALFSL